MATVLGSTLTWLDYSEQDRRRVLDTVDLFREKDTRDALGLGTIRDGFADLLSPGTSTIQTRARYFLLIPWLYKLVEVSGSAKSATARARLAELDLIEALIEAGDLDGLIGRQARRGLKRLPSDVYWQGLHAWRVRSVPVARDSYHRWIDDRVALPDSVSEEGEPVHGIWHAGLPDPPPGFPAEAALTLPPAEADYLAERLIAHWPNTLLGWLVRDGGSVDQVEFPWLHPELERMPSRIQEQLHHGRCFSEAILGAQLLYNLMLARLIYADHDGPSAPVERWESEIERWEAMVAGRAAMLEAWDLSHFWEIVASSGAQVSAQTREFVKAWVNHVRSGAGELRIASDQRCEDWVRSRECWVKKKQARLINKSMLLSWRGESGAQQLSYRWDITRAYAEEIGRGRGV
ncbi:MAG TPA: DUF6361 family protein [Solirubrobacterales bacterium]|nr:DUF6361 family protein [Solirubrobacterales bacterium]